MTDASYSHKFMSALADSLGWNSEAVQKALAEIVQLQNQAQELELSMQGKAPTNHASQQGVFGLADELMYGHVKIAHEVSNDSTAGIAVSPDAVYAYAPAKGMATEMPVSGDYLTSTDFSRYNTSGHVSLTKNGQLCVTSTIVFTTSVPPNVNVDELTFDNKLNVPIPCVAWWGEGSLVNPYISNIMPSGHLDATGALNVKRNLYVVVTAGIYPIFAKVKES